MEKREGNIVKFLTGSPENVRLKLDKSSKSVEEEDIVESALDMARGVAEKLDTILDKLARLDDIELKIININKTMQDMKETFKGEISRINQELKRVGIKTGEIKDGLEFMENEVKKLERSKKKKVKKRR